ncbi:radical SAM protein [Patescibacteria group bacterium]
MTYLSLKKSLKVTKGCLPATIKSRISETPLWVHFYLTRKCNLNCDYCHVKDNTKKDISTKEIKKIIDKLYSLGIRAIAFFGGEPTLRKDFCEILKYSVDKRIFSYFTTNGTLLNEDYIKRIVETGVDYIELSVDSLLEFNESRKDYVRSKKVLDLLLKYREKYGFGLKTHIVLTNKNLATVVKTIEQINDKNKIPLTIGYICRSVDGNIADDESLFFNSEESKQKLIKVVNEIIELKRKGAQIMDPYSYFKGMKGFVYGDLEWNCMAGKYSFSVDYDGSIQLCTGLKPYRMNVLAMGKDFFKKRKLEIEETKRWCTKLCYSTCHNTTAYMIDHPIEALIGK